MQRSSSHPHLEVRSAAIEIGRLVPGTRYRAVALLGLGGMSAVYEVEHTELAKPFVMKLLYPDLARRSDFVSRLKQEQRALGRIEHPNIVTVTDAGATAQGLPFFVMERLRGRALSQELRRRAPLEVAEAVEIVTQVLDGLAAAHELGIVHRDVKPGNVFVTCSRRVKLLDFGIAKDLSQLDRESGHSTLLATPRYMSPEQARRCAVDHRSDLYSVGLLLWHALTGRAPYPELFGAADLVAAHAHDPLPRVACHRPGVHPLLDELTAALLAKDPAQRPQSAAMVAHVLRSAALERGAGWGRARAVTHDAPTLAGERPAAFGNPTLAATPRALGEHGATDSSALPTLIFDCGAKPAPPRGRGRRAGLGALTVLAAALFGLAALGGVRSPAAARSLVPVVRPAGALLGWRPAAPEPPPPEPVARYQPEPVARQPEGPRAPRPASPPDRPRRARAARRVLRQTLGERGCPSSPTLVVSSALRLPGSGL